MIHFVVTIMLAGALPILLTLIAKAGKFTLRDNHQARVWQAQLSGWRQRAHWAHQNAFETFPLFVAAAILARLTHPTPYPDVTVVAALWAYPALRVVYSVFYVADFAPLRSLAWMASLASIAVLFLSAL